MISGFNNTISTLLNTRAYQATRYISPKLVIRATRRQRIDARARRIELIVTIGQPNYRERQFIKLLKRAGEPFPVRAVQLREFPKKRAKRARKH
jgi:hypothetical protein